MGRRATTGTGAVPTAVVTAVSAVAGLLGLTACAAPVLPGHAVVGAVPEADRALVRAFVEASNRAADEGPEAQAAFLRATQEPTVPLPPGYCFGRLSLYTRAVERTLRPAPDFSPPDRAPGAPPVQGAQYVVATAVTATQGGTLVREEVGSKHLVVRDGRVYGYAPCPS